ncbi:MAG: hypothetical protein AAB910_03700 [Patescibacteria group bacterium]|mgnify:FL=1
MKLPLHRTVTLAEGVRIPPEAWHLHGEVLQCGISRHRVVVKGFPICENGQLGISVAVSPLDAPVPLRQRES